jgi:hypothetical protein
MSAQHCCQMATRHGDNVRRPASRWRRASAIAGWIVPGAMLVLIPKCPLCLAGYIAVVSGVGMSVTTAAYLRTSLLVLCVSTLLFVASKALIRGGSRNSGLHR